MFADRRGLLRSRSPAWRLAPLALIVIALVGSVVVPARQTWMIAALLRQTTDVIAPTRVADAALRAGLAEEIAALQAYGVTADNTLRSLYRTTAADDERHLAELNALRVRMPAAAQRHIAAVRLRMAEWRNSANGVADHPGPTTAAALAAAQPHYDAVLRAIDDLSSDLAAEMATRDERVRSLERSSLVWNAVLVFAALAVLAGVLRIMAREQRLAAILRRRVDEESELRQLARALSAAVTAEEAMEAVAAGTLLVANVAGAYVEWLVPGEAQADALVAFDGQAAPQHARVASGDSLTGTTLARRSAEGLIAVAPIAPRLAMSIGDARASWAGLVTPLVSPEGTFGALALLRDDPAAVFADDARRQLQLIGGLASATLRRIDGMTTERRALDDARRRARQEVALREAAEALAGAFTSDAVTERIAHAALDAMEAQGAFVEAIVASPDGSPPNVAVRAAAGTRVPPQMSVVPFAGSLTQQVLDADTPLLIPDLRSTNDAGAVDALRDQGGAAIVVPLGAPGQPVGALFVLSPPLGHFRADDVTRASIFGHLAALAYEKVRILDAAYEGRRQLERVLQSRSRLMRGFSHDVKNPIGAADGYAELLSEGIYGALTADQRESVARIRRCIKTGLGLIDDLHALARAESAEIASPLVLVDVATLVRTVGEEYQAAARAGGLSLVIAIEPELPSLETSEPRVRQIVSNLLSNAIKYTDSGAVTLRALRRQLGPSGAAGDWVLVEVIDTGVGIPINQHDVIFEEFSRVGKTDKPGAGLGLAISRLLAQALGGHIGVVSDLGHGSTFTLWLPVTGAAVSLAAQPSRYGDGPSSSDASQ